MVNGQSLHFLTHIYKYLYENVGQENQALGQKKVRKGQSFIDSKTVGILEFEMYDHSPYLHH